MSYDDADAILSVSCTNLLSIITLPPSVHAIRMELRTISMHILCWLQVFFLIIEPIGDLCSDLCNKPDQIGETLETYFNS